MDEYTEHMADLNSRIEVLSQKLGPDLENMNSDVSVLVQADELSTLFLKRYEATSAVSDLNASITIVEREIELVPKCHPSQILLRNNLGSRLGRRFEATHFIEDLNRGLGYCSEVYEATQQSDPRRAIRASNLSEMLRQKFEHTEKMSDFNKAVELMQDAAPATPAYVEVMGAPMGTVLSHSPDGCKVLNALSIRLCESYERTGSRKDLDRSIEILDKLLGVVRHDPSRHIWLRNLSIALRIRYDVSNSRSDIARGIKISHMILKDIPLHHTHRGLTVGGLGLWHGKRYEHYGRPLKNDMSKETVEMHIDKIDDGIPSEEPATKVPSNPNDDLDCAIKLLGSAAVLKESHPEANMYLMNLGYYCLYRAMGTGSIEDLNRAIDVISRSRERTAKSHPFYARQSWLLGMSQHRLFRLSNSPKHLYEAALLNYQIMLETPSYTPVAHRVQAGRFYFNMCAEAADWTRAFDVANIAIRLLPKVTSRSLENSDKQFLLGDRFFTAFASDAAAVALLAGKGLLTALDLLETGRAVLVASIRETRADMGRLSQYPELRAEYLRLQKELSRPATQRIQHHNANKEFETLLGDIRAVPGLGRFSLSPNKEEMTQAAASGSGSIVVVNISKYRCDALLIRGDQEPQLVLLSELRFEDIQQKAKSDSTIGSLKTLKWLWSTIGRPVLEALGHTNRPVDLTSWPRVWWIPTGLLTKFPLHAAGFHDIHTSDSVMDRVMSSYSSSISSIIEGRQRQRPLSTSSLQKSAILVGMERTPGRIYGDLHWASEEIGLVRNQFTSLGVDPREPQRTKQDVLRHIRGCLIFHFAGHGYTDPINPSDSTLLLEDWETDSLTVGDLLALNLQEEPPLLAYLSACGTGQIEEERFMDESINLINACQLAGFRHVIGTLWEVDDQSCIDLATVVYQTMGEDELSDYSVCQGLHRGVIKQRDLWRSGRPDSGRFCTRTGKGEESSSDYDSDYDSDDLFWVPYVHYGV
ncbi:hypothetical protein PG993_014907 [Apiospora rasikravindrae]|uniref:CHAT domain-containing protein n=1 Tax=Apiospora rasikravindrae TaxID=990691 RepID=A0ABR1RP67_9PEZI